MKRSVDMLIEEHAYVANISSLAFVSLVLSLALFGFIGDKNSPIAIVISVFLGATLLLSFLSMVLATFILIKNRNQIADWGIFMAIIWLLPYFGISAYLGFSNIIKIIEVNRIKN